MNKAAKLITAAVAAASLSISAGAGASACMYFSDAPSYETVSLERISDSTKFNCYPSYGSESLIKDRKVKKGSLAIEADDVLTVSAGTTLTLNCGAHIDGTLYIQQGGKLVVNGGSVIVCGNLVSDGDIRIKKDAGLSLRPGSMFLVNNSGSLDIKSESFSAYMSNYACYGKATAEYLSDAEMEALAPDPVMALVSAKGKQLQTVTDKKTLASYTANLGNYADSTEAATQVTLVFDNGSVFRMTKLGNTTDLIGTVYPGTLCGLADEVRNWN